MGLAIFILFFGLIISLDNSSTKSDMLYQRQVKLEKLQGQLHTVKEQKADTQQQLKEKAKAEADLKSQIDELNKQLQAKREKASLLARAANAVTHTQTAYAAPAPVYASANIPALLQRIKMCESGGNYTAYNPSGASGAYQIIPGTWGGYRGYSEARSAPPGVQDARALQIFNSEGTGPWVSSQGCWG